MSEGENGDSNAKISGEFLARSGRARLIESEEHLKKGDTKRAAEAVRSGGKLIDQAYETRFPDGEKSAIKEGLRIYPQLTIKEEARLVELSNKDDLTELELYEKTKLGNKALG